MLGHLSLSVFFRCLLCLLRHISLLLFLLTLLLSSFLIRLMWNRSLVPHITALKPIRTLGDAFLLSMSLSVLKCC